MPISSKSSGAYDRRLIHFLLFLILCLAVGGAFYSLSAKSVPFATSGADEGFVNQLRFLVYRSYLIDKTKEYAAMTGEDTVTWDRVEFLFDARSQRWNAHIYKKSQPDALHTIFDLDHDGTIIKDPL